MKKIINLALSISIIVFLFSTPCIAEPYLGEFKDILKGGISAGSLIENYPNEFEYLSTTTTTDTTIDVNKKTIDRDNFLKLFLGTPNENLSTTKNIKYDMYKRMIGNKKYLQSFAGMPTMIPVSYYFTKNNGHIEAIDFIVGFKGSRLYTDWHDVTFLPITNLESAVYKVMDAYEDTWGIYHKKENLKPYEENEKTVSEVHYYWFLKTMTHSVKVITEHKPGKENVIGSAYIICKIQIN